MEFTAHRGLLSYHSKYFQARLSGRWGEENVVDLAEADEITFPAFIEYVYTHRFEMRQNRMVRRATTITAKDVDKAATISVGELEATVEATSSQILDGNQRDNKTDSSLQICELYVLGDFLMSPGFKTVAFDALHEHLVAGFTLMDAENINYIYNNTTPGSSLRRFAADWTALPRGVRKPDGFQAVGHKLPQDFLVDILVIMSRVLHANEEHTLQTQKKWREIDKCRYHEHEQDGNADDAEEGRKSKDGRRC